VLIIEWRGLFWAPIVGEGLAWLLVLAWILMARRTRLAAVLVVALTLARWRNGKAASE